MFRDMSPIRLALRFPDMQRREAATGAGAHIPRRSTLLELLALVNEETENEEEAVGLVTRLVNSGRVALTGNFRGARFPTPA